MNEAKKALVLVVDDEEANRRVLQPMLAADGHRVATAPDGARALEAAAEEAPDLVLLDVMMPGMDGFEVAARLKSAAASKHVTFGKCAVRCAKIYAEHVDEATQ
jgi:two-component system cell cycle response regulator